MPFRPSLTIADSELDDLLQDIPRCAVRCTRNRGSGAGRPHTPGRGELVRDDAHGVLDRDPHARAPDGSTGPEQRQCRDGAVEEPVHERADPDLAAGARLQARAVWPAVPEGAAAQAP